MRQPRQGRSLTAPLDEPWFDIGNLAGGKSISAVKDLPTQRDNGGQKPVLPNVIGQGLQVFVVEPGKKQAGRVE